MTRKGLICRKTKQPTNQPTNQPIKKPTLDDIVTVHKYLSHNENLFYARVTSGQSGTWSLTK